MTEADDKLREHYTESLYTFDKEKKDLDDEDEYGTLESDEGVELLNNLIDKIKNNKGKLH
jgi:uncharacterized protein YfeS